MEKDISKIMKEQFEKLPTEVCIFVATSPWRDTIESIIRQYSIPPTSVSSVEDEILLVLLGLVHPDDFRGALAEQTGGELINLSGVANEIENKIFAPIRQTLINFVESEQGVRDENKTKVSLKSDTLNEDVVTKPMIRSVPPRTWEQVPEVVPENLPTEEPIESFLPSLAPKIAQEEVQNTPSAPTLPQEVTPESPINPFEEKMKKSFSVASVNVNEFAIDPPTPKEPIAPTQFAVSATVPDSTARLAHDQYREPIE